MAKAKYFKGQRTTTKGQQKKLYTQMTEAEIDYLYTKLQAIDKIYLTTHMFDKLRLYDLNLDIIYESLKRATKESIIEYNNGRGNQRRVLIRDTKPIQTEEGDVINASMVFDLDTHDLVTIWVNSLDDRHENVDMHYYNKNLKII